MNTNIKKTKVTEQENDPRMLVGSQLQNLFQSKNSISPISPNLILKC